MELFWLLVFVISLTVLVQASHYFTNAAERFGLLVGIPSFLVGVTILAIGTSLPELVASIVAVFRGSPEIVIANVVGSNVTNIFLILGLVAVVARRITVERKLFNVDLSLLIGVTFLLIATAWDGAITLTESVIYIFGFLIYLGYSLHIEESGKYGHVIWNNTSWFGLDKSFLPLLAVLFIAPAFIYVGAYYTIESVLRIAEAFEISTSVIALSGIALGTSLPELAVSLSAVRKGKAEMAVGNVLGSNIFNTLAVIGISGLFGTLTASAEMVTFGFAILIIATLMYFFVARESRISKWEGWLLLLFYIVFLSQIVRFIAE